MLDEIFAPLLKDSITRQFQQGNILIYQGEVPRNLYLVKSGIVKLYNITTQGDERIATFKMPGDLFPTSWSLGELSPAFYYYEAQTDGEMYTIPTTEFNKFIQNNPQAMSIMAQIYLRKYAGSLMRVTALEQPKASDKVLYTLYYLIQLYGIETKPDIYKIKIQLSQQMVADLIGLTRETTAAELVKLKRRGILSYKGREYVINREKLILAIGEDNFKGLRG